MSLVTEATFPEFARYIEKFDDLAVDDETTGLNLHTTDLVAGVALYNGEKSFYVPIRHASTEKQSNVTPDQYKTMLGIIGRIRIHRNHNCKFDRHGLSRDGCKFVGGIKDTQSGCQLLDENNSLKLKDLGKRYLGHDADNEEKKLLATLNRWGYSKGEMWRLPPEIAGPYAEQDTVLAWNLVDYLENNLDDELHAIWEELNAFSELLRRMEARGYLVDVERLQQRKAEALNACSAISVRLRSEFGRPINVNSPAQIARVFGIDKADEETLMAIRDRPGVMEVLKYRWYMKAVNTYYNKYLGFLDGQNVIHTDFNITGTVTGRLSSSDPNMQQIPRWSEEQKVKDVFVARPGYKLVSLDYSQAEIRVAAHYTKDPAVLEIFSNGLDYHTETAKKLGIERQKAKVINLALNYGAGVFTIARQLGMNESLVKPILADYHKKFPGFRKTSRECEKVADERGYVRYWTGRRRHFNTQFAQSRAAFNSIVQGGTGEMVRRTMQRMEREIPEFHQQIQVHDSIEGEVPEELVDDIIPEIVRIAEDQPQFSVPMKVDVKTGYRMSELKEYHVA